MAHVSGSTCSCRESAAAQQGHRVHRHRRPRREDGHERLRYLLRVDRRGRLFHVMPQVGAQLRGVAHGGHAVGVDRRAGGRLEGEGDAEPPRVGADLLQERARRRGRPIGVAERRAPLSRPAARRCRAPSA